MDDATLVWQSAIAQAALTFIAAVGVFQVIALRNGIEGLAWPIGLQHRRIGYAAASVLLGAALLGGLLLAWAAKPLPASISAMAFSAGSGLALLVSVGGAAVRRWWSLDHHAAPLPQGQMVDLGPLQATLYRPAGQGPFPALCLLPDPTAPDDNPAALVQALTGGGISVLALDRRALGVPDRLTLQGFVAVGISHLAQWPETKTGLVGLAGIGLGGDLALRSAAMDPGVAAVLAIEPVLSPNRPLYGIDALRALSWPAAQRRIRRWRRSTLVKELNALAAIPTIAPRPVAIVVGGEGEATTADNLEILHAEGDCVLVPAVRQNAAQYAAQWMMTHLA